MGAFAAPPCLSDGFLRFYEGTVSLAIYRQKGVAPKVCDLRNGNLYDLPAEMWEKSGAQGVLLKNLPLTDCPIALIFD